MLAVEDLEMTVEDFNQDQAQVGLVAEALETAELDKQILAAVAEAEASLLQQAELVDLVE